MQLEPLLLDSMQMVSEFFQANMKYAHINEFELVKIR